MSEGVSMEGDGESIDQTDEDEEEEVEGGVPVTIAMVKAWVRDVKQVSLLMQDHLYSKSKH